ncbi:hypothetical protein McpSp1_15210 [Methanocorpusculaceae archaeon Sp1]|uniref:Uncharacterized protein n=1 Tax=Methanorbis furvi TaxID=3028299 RepID=A0AAE4S9S6_9EURY|nr:hypothetical protein [Methanocorpusculaceae archaeon Sp1]MDV0441501.1 hypothetical protein [Methanocorpusculaceae archaeon Ag1]
MKKILLAAVLCVALAMVSVAGCVGADPVVGNWETTPVFGVYVSVQFVNDGTGSIAFHTDLSPAAATTMFTWEKTADNTYKVMSSDKHFSAGTYKLSSDGQTLTSDSGLIVLHKA